MFVPLSKSEDEFLSYWNEMNWSLALGWDSQKAKEIKSTLKIDNIPCLVIVNPQTAKVVSMNGVAEVSE